MRRWQTVVSCLLILLLRLPYAAAQALHQCKMPDGRLVLTNEPCPGEDRKTAPPQTAPVTRPPLPVTVPPPQPAESVLNASSSQEQRMQEELRAAMQAYADALTAWRLTLDTERPKFAGTFWVIHDSEGQRLNTTYRLTSQSYVEGKTALQIIWKAAKAHLDRATQWAKSQ